VSKFAVLAAGGTGGHMFPAQSLAEELLRRGWRVALATDKRGLNYADGFPEAVERRALKAATPARGGIIAKIAAPLALISGTIEAVRWFKSDRPDAVIGFGGYPAAPATAAAIRLKVPRIIHEQNAVLGRANKLFVKRVDLLACGIGKPTNTPSGVETTIVGNPIRDTALSFADTPYTPIGEGPIRLLAFGGSQGSKALSDMIPNALAGLPEALRGRLQTTLQVREAGLDAAKEQLAAANIQADVVPFFDDMPKRISEAHLVIARAGASTCAELTALGRPAILVPLPSAMGDHQTANARSLEQSGGAILLPEKDMTEQGMTDLIASLLNDPTKLSQMAAAAKTLGKPNAATDLADLVEEYAARGR